MKPENISTRIPPDDAPAPGTYRHYKGALYEVMGMAQHSETDEWMVHYQALYGDFSFWLRPLSIWNEPVAAQATETEVQHRFTRVTSSTQ